MSDRNNQEYSINVYCSLSLKKDLFGADVHRKHMDIMDAMIERVLEKENRNRQYSEDVTKNKPTTEELVATTILPKAVKAENKTTTAKIFFLASRKVSSGRTS